MTAAANVPTPTTAPRASSSEERLVVYQHSDLLYWWVGVGLRLLLRPHDLVARQVGRARRGRTAGADLSARVARHLVRDDDAVRAAVHQRPGARAEVARAVPDHRGRGPAGAAHLRLGPAAELRPAAARAHEPGLLPVLLDACCWSPGCSRSSSPTGSSTGSSRPAASASACCSARAARTSPPRRSRRCARATTSSCTACWACGSWASAPAISTCASARRAAGSASIICATSGASAASSARSIAWSAAGRART